MTFHMQLSIIIQAYERADRITEDEAYNTYRDIEEIL